MLIDILICYKIDKVYEIRLIDRNIKMKILFVCIVYKN
jgi:hypothetical protein